MRIRELRYGAGELEEEVEEEERGEVRGGGEVVAVARLKAKRALVGAGARVLFYPTLLYNVLRNRFEAEFRWWDRVDQYVLLGAVPFSSDVPHLKQLGVRGVVTLNEPYETLVPTSLYQAHGINHLEIPTRDYLFAPSPEDICRAVDFIHGNASHGGSTYVHCKAGRGRSTTIVLCYLIRYRNMTPEEALDHARSVRPRVLLAPSQWQAVKLFSTLTTRCLSIQSSNLTCSVKSGELISAVTARCLSIQSSNQTCSVKFGEEYSEAAITETETDGYTTEFDGEHFVLPLCQSMLSRPARCLSIQSSNQTCSVKFGEEYSEAAITETEIDGYTTEFDGEHFVLPLCQSMLSRPARCLSIQSSNQTCSVKFGEEYSEAAITETEIDGYTTEFDGEHFVLPLCQSMLSRPTSPTGCNDAVFITDADLEGYETYADAGKDAVSVEVVVRHKPIMRRLSCFLGSLKLTNNCEPPPSRFTEVRAC